MLGFHQGQPKLEGHKYLQAPALSRDSRRWYFADGAQTGGIALKCPLTVRSGELKLRLAKIENPARKTARPQPVKAADDTAEHTFLCNGDGGRNIVQPFAHSLFSNSAAAQKNGFETSDQRGHRPV